ncbi:DeoR family transcriptional regulator [Candidatus Uabimicrobium sp. HlEnr_7]|uniref:DeoR family transcriptional regulator n=1 Tax=Candidatus Uabimicrobium helgolandensis TaxID=3095367 RepID=UPI0035573428
MQVKLVRNIWQNWGFKGNPFDTNALTLHSKLLPISKAFVGRSMNSDESTQLLNVIRNSGGGRVIVEGHIGVGKTTLVNYHRYLWEQEADDKIFTPIKEISVYGKTTAKNLLVEILGHISSKMLLLAQEKKIKKSQQLKKIRFLYDIFYRESHDIQGNIFGCGISYNRQTQLNIPDLTESQLIGYLMDIIGEVQDLGYGGIFLHFDNLELLSSDDLKKCRMLFEEIRDILLLPDIYYIFVARKGFFSQVISPSERVSSIMGWPIQVPPLTYQEVIEVINTRYALLSIKQGKEIKPVENSFIKYLYELHRGKIRFVMDSIARVVLGYPYKKHRTLRKEEAIKFLTNIIKQKTKALSGQELVVLKEMIKQHEFSNKNIATSLGLQPSNVSVHFKKLLEENFIYLVRKEGAKNIYSIREELVVLKNKIHLKIEDKKYSKKEARKITMASYIKKHCKITVPCYQNIAKVSEATARRDLQEYVKEGLLQKRGKGRATVYITMD